MTEEIWKDIAGFEGSYQINKKGEVRSLKKGFEGKIIKYRKMRDGYYYYRLRKDEKNWLIAMHRLIAMTFIPNPDSLPQVNHKDENKLNNEITNLEWCSRKYNINYGTGHARSTKKIIAMRAKKVRCIETGEIFESINAAARYVNDYVATLSHVCNKDPSFYTAGGYRWEFVEKENA